MKRQESRHVGAPGGAVATAVVLVGVLAASPLMQAASAHTSPASNPASNPAPTTTPSRPGIDIARAKFDLPDPFLLTAGGKYYLYVSTAFLDPRRRNVPVFVGSPGHWGSPTDALPRLPGWAVPIRRGGTTWAPQVHQFGSQYVLYFSSTVVDTAPRKHCIGLATSSSPSGPFTPRPGPLVCQLDQGGDIDAQIVVDADGPDGAAHPDYLVWKSDNNSTPGLGRPGLWAQPLSNNGRALRGRPVRLLTARRPWEGSLIEAPEMAESPDGRMWLYFSAGKGFARPDYAIGAAECAGPLGPCHDRTRRPLVASNAQGAGPGEESVFIAPDGSTWILYNPWYAGQPFRLARPAEAVRIGYRSAGPYLGVAGTFPAP